MKIRTRVLAGVATVALVGGMAALAVPAYATTVTVNVANATVTCDTITGTLKFGTPLTLTGPTSGASTTTVKSTIGGCTSPQVNSGNSIFSATGTGTLTGNGGSNCTGIQGTSNSTGTLTIAWKAPKGYKFTPTETVGTKTAAFSQTVISQSQGQTFTVPAHDGSSPTVSQGPWAGTTYGEFQVGGAYGTTNIHNSGANDDFTGGDNGHSSWINAITNQGVTDLVGACTSTGIKSVTFGIGGTFGG